MNRRIQVRTRLGWTDIDSIAHPRVGESQTIFMRGLAPGDVVRIGVTEVAANSDGEAELRPSTDEHLRGHVGLIAVSISRMLIGEIELVPDKMSESAYLELRSELQRLWTDLIFDPAGVASVSAGPPPAGELWQRLERPVTNILEAPASRLVSGTSIRRMERVRRASELKPAVVRAGLRGRPALTTAVQATTDTPENDLVAATLILLRNHARRTDPGLVGRLDRLLQQPLFRESKAAIRSLTWGMRSDRRYAEVLRVYRILNRPELAPTEGPGELRLGIPALSRLYEYWVFLQLLQAARARYGPPTGSGFDRLAVKTTTGRARLDLPAGTTVTFPGDVHVAFEPTLNTSGTGWMGLEYVPHPDSERQQLVATPDVVVFQAGAQPALTVFDAKYVGRAFVERDAARIHEKYARVRWNGLPIVRNVVAVHPHRGLSRQWAGYGHICMAPNAVDEVPLPPRPDHATAAAAAASPQRPAAVAGLLDRPNREARSVIADQFWMHRELAGRRIDIDALRHLVAGTDPIEQFELVMPRLDVLLSFARAAEQHGWRIRWIDSPERADQIQALIDLIDERISRGGVIVVSGDQELLDLLPADDEVEVFDDLSVVPLL